MIARIRRALVRALAAADPVLVLLVLLAALAALSVAATWHREGLTTLPPPRRVTLTTYESYPRCCTDRRANQKECRDFSGCEYKGKFKLMGDGVVMPEWWVRGRNIAAVHSADASYVGKWVRIAYNNRFHDVKIIDVCSDGDTKNGECTFNKSKWRPPGRTPTGFLIDLEANTARRMGFTKGIDEARFTVLSGAPSKLFLSGTPAY